MINLLLRKKKILKKGILKTMYYLRIDQAPAASFEETCQLIASRTTLSEFEVELAVNELAKAVVENAYLGRGTKLGRLGKVTLRQSGHGVDTIDEVSLDMMEGLSLGYVSSLYIKKNLRQIKFRIDRSLVKEKGKE